MTVAPNSSRFTATRKTLRNGTAEVQSVEVVPVMGNADPKRICTSIGGTSRTSRVNEPARIEPQKVIWSGKLGR